jgi:GWxTD domain-containing protein
MRKLAPFVICLLCVSCAALRLERRLPPKLKAWYKHHSVIMEYRVSKEIDAKKPMERDYWLRLPNGFKMKYMEMFWEMRETGMEEEYKHRQEVANTCFRGEGVDGEYTDRGRIMLLCGQPDYQDFRDERGDLYQEGEEKWGYAKQEGKRWFQYWGYWHGFGFFQNLRWIVFEYDALERWRYVPSTESLDMEFLEYWRFRMAPTPEGWQLWEKALLEGQ